MVGLFMTAASTRSQLPSLVSFVYRGRLISGTWLFQAVSIGPTVNTAVAPPTPQKNAVGPRYFCCTPNEKGTPFSKPHKSSIWNFSPLPHCLYPGCQFIHACLTDLFQRPIPWRKDPQIYLLSKILLSTARAHCMPSSGDVTLVVTLKEAKKLLARPRTLGCFFMRIFKPGVRLVS